MKYPIVFKSVNISDETHKKLQSIYDLFVKKYLVWMKPNGEKMF